MWLENKKKVLLKKFISSGKEMKIYKRSNTEVEYLFSVTLVTKLIHAVKCLVWTYSRRLEIPILILTLNVNRSN